MRLESMAWLMPSVHKCFSFIRVPKVYKNTYGDMYRCYGDTCRSKAVALLGLPMNM